MGSDTNSKRIQSLPDEYKKMNGSEHNARTLKTEEAEKTNNHAKSSSEEKRERHETSVNPTEIVVNVMDTAVRSINDGSDNESEILEKENERQETITEKKNDQNLKTKSLSEHQVVKFTKRNKKPVCFTKGTKARLLDGKETSRTYKNGKRTRSNDPCNTVKITMTLFESDSTIEFRQRSGQDSNRNKRLRMTLDLCIHSHSPCAEVSQNIQTRNGQESSFQSQTDEVCTREDTGKEVMKTRNVIDVDSDLQYETKNGSKISQKLVAASKTSVSGTERCSDNSKSSKQGAQDINDLWDRLKDAFLFDENNQFEKTNVQFLELEPNAEMVESYMQSMGSDASTREEELHDDDSEDADVQ